MRGFPGLAILLLATACRTIEPGSGDSTRSPAAPQDFERYLAAQPHSLGVDETAVRYVPAMHTDRIAANQAKGAVIFLPRQPAQNDSSNASVPPYLVAMNGMGWHVIRGNIAPSFYSGQEALNTPAVSSIARQIRELRRSGYRRIVIAGDGSAAANAFAVLKPDHADTPDALVLTAPSWTGPAQRPDGSVNPTFAINYSLYEVAVEGLGAETPVVLAFFHEDAEEPRDRYHLTRQMLGEAGVPHFIINKPGGVTGSSGSWEQSFGQRFAACIHGFLIEPEGDLATDCATPPPSPSDHRWMAVEADLDGSPATLIDAARFTALLPEDVLHGRSPEGFEVTYEFKLDRTVVMTGVPGHEEERIPYAVRAGRLCVDTQPCNRLYRFGHRLVIAVDADTEEIVMRIKLDALQAARLDGLAS